MADKRLPELERNLQSALPADLKDLATFVFESVDSTMLKAREIASSIENYQAILVVARNQSAGRGRRGRPWLPAEGALYATYVFRSALDSAALGPLPLVVGLAVRNALSSRERQLMLKWPNDLVTPAGKKVGGILVELSPSPEGNQIFCGIGLNLTAVPPEISEAEDLLHATGQSMTSEKAAAVISGPLFKNLNRFEREGFASISNEWLEHALYLNQEVELVDGNSQRHGLFSGLGENGELALKVNGAVQFYTSGDVSLRKR